MFKWLLLPIVPTVALLKSSERVSMSLLNTIVASCNKANFSEGWMYNDNYIYKASLLNTKFNFDRFILENYLRFFF